MYRPKFIDTSEVVLSDDILELSELLAENTHENWAKKRLEEGFVYGEKRNDELKTHPCLVPYEELPENEKDYDRKISIEALKVIVKLGFKIEKE